MVNESLDNINPLFKYFNNMKNITLEPLASLGLQGTISMQPQMVAGGYQNPSCLGYTFGGNPLPWDVNIPSGNNASSKINSNWNYPSPMGENSP